MHFDLDGMTLGQVRDTPSDSNICVKYLIPHDKKELWPGHGFLLCVVYDLDLGDMTWIKVTTHPWIMDNNCVILSNPI